MILERVRDRWKRLSARNARKDVRGSRAIDTALNSSLAPARRLLAIAVLALSPLAAPAAVAQPCICLTCMLGTSEAFRATGGSMMPTIAPEACFVVDLRDAAREGVKPGDIIAYLRGEEAYVTRVVATAGHRVKLTDGRVAIDGTPVETADRPPLVTAEAIPADRCPTPVGDACKVRRLTETLPNGETYEVLDVLVGSMMDETEVFEVPEGHVFGLSDNRDNAIDSRMQTGGPGYIALDQVIGPVISIATPLR